MRPLLLLLVLCATAHAGEPVPLWTALEKGQIRAGARSTGGASHAVVTIENRTGEPITVDVNGAMFLPVKPVSTAAPATTESPWTQARTRARGWTQTQPLGVGLTVAGSKVTTVALEPEATLAVPVLTVCLNHDVSAPGSSTPLVVATTPAPEAAARVLASWRDDPTQSHDAIQERVWAEAQALYAFHEVPVDGGPAAVAPVASARTCERRPEETPLPPDAARVVVVSGEVAVLTAAGQLLLGAPDEPLRPIAARVRGIAAEPGAVSALVDESPLGGGLAVVRYDLGRRAWVTELRATGTDLRWARATAAIVERDGRLVLVQRDGERALGRARGALVVDLDPKKAIVFAPADGDGETRIVRLARVSRSYVVTEEVLNARVVSACAQGGVVYAVDDLGGLCRLDGKQPRWLALPKDLGGLGPAEKARRVAASASGILLETDRRFVLKRGPARPFVVRLDPRATLLRDAGSGDLFAVARGTLRKWVEDEHGWVVVRGAD